MTTAQSKAGSAGAAERAGAAAPLEPDPSAQLHHAGTAD